MRIESRLMWTMAWVGALTMGMAGCQRADKPAAKSGTAGSAAPADQGQDHDHEHGHDHDHAPETLADAVAEIDEHTQSLATAYGDGNHEQADNELHVLVELLSAVEGLLDKSALTTEQKETARKAAASLDDALGKLHEGHHGGTETTGYDEVSATITDSVSALQQLVSSAGASS